MDIVRVVPDTPLSYYQVRYNFSLKQGSSKQDIAQLDLAMHPLGDAEYGDTQLQKAAHGAYNAWNTNMYTGDFGTNLTLESVTATSFKANGHTLYEQNYVDGSPWAGAGSGKCLPWETSMCVSLYTYVRGTFESDARRKRGRVYLPPQTSNQLENSNSGFYSNSDLPTFLGKVHDWLQDAQQDDLGVKIADLSVYSRVDGVLRDVKNVYMDAKFDSQRRRQNREIAGVIGVVF